jgi:hypothetical protein
MCAATVAMPAHVYAPYFETWSRDGLTATAQVSGARYFALAFLATLSKTSCELAWNGRENDVVANGRYLSDISSLRGIGGDVIPSFGGWSADQRGTEIADSCKSVKRIAAAYEAVITKYDVTRLDMDIEGRSLWGPRGIDRRNKALKRVETWAAAHNRLLQVSYTLSASPRGLNASRIAVLRNARANGTRVDVVNIMAFDYYDGATRDMGSAAIGAAEGLLAQLHTLWPTKTRAQRAAQAGVTLMPGIDDYPPGSEATSLADATRVYDYAQTNGFDTFSIWSIQRDKINRTWDFSRLLAPFTTTSGTALPAICCCTEPPGT